MMSTAAAEPVRLRMAAITPDGTSWARELIAFSREVESVTQRQVQFKWYFGGIAGDEIQVMDRIRRGQLDGTSGSLMCSQLAPSLKVTRLIGMFRNRGEFHFVVERLRPRIHLEMQKAGFADLGVANLGHVLVFSQTPIRSMAELRAARIWSWNLDEVWNKLAPALGLRSVMLPVTDAERALVDKRVDAVYAFPQAALAFQWSAHTRYFTELELGALPACIVISLKAMDALPTAVQKAIRDAGARLSARVEEQGRLDDAALTGGLFEKQGLTKIKPDDAFRRDFLDAAKQARDTLGPSIVPLELLSETLSWLADYRVDRR